MTSLFFHLNELAVSLRTIMRMPSWHAEERSEGGEHFTGVESNAASTNISRHRVFLLGLRAQPRGRPRVLATGYECRYPPRSVFLLQLELLQNSRSGED